MKESGLWATTRENLSPHGKLVRIETATSLGVPDVAYVLTRPKPGSIAATGWIELKKLDAYPVKPSTPITIARDKLTKDQVDFARDWETAGGRAYMLLRAPPWYLLFDAAGIRGVWERSVTAADGPAVAKAAGMGRFPTGAILRVLAP